MTLRELFREAGRAAWAARVSSLLILLVAAAMCFSAVATVGQTAAAAAAVEHSMQDAGSRQLTIVDGSREGFITLRTGGATAGLSTVDQVTLLGTPVDVVNGGIGPGSMKVPLWPVLSDVTETGELVRGRWPRPGEALVTTQTQLALGMEDPVGFVTSPDGIDQYSIVGLIEPAAQFADLAGGVIAVPPAPQLGREMRVLIDDVSNASATVRIVLTILKPDDPTGVHVTSPSSLAATAEQLDAEMSGFGRSLLLLILAVGGFFVATVVLADTLIHRRDLGRRRTLGISRTDLTLLVVLRTSLTATLGAGLGGAAAVLMNTVLGSPTPSSFTAAVGVLAVLVAAIAALGPALSAAMRDPVRVMRTA